jgi:ADP-L-glycero-D-manno-heptose 6-epimerase
VTALVTGAAGFIGSNLVRLLDSPICCDPRDARMYHPDEIEKVIDLQKPDVVYHLGAISSTTEHDISLISKNNVFFSCMLLEKCINLNIPFVYASSASVYGLGNSGFSESVETTLPLNYYAISKDSFDKFAIQKIKDNKNSRIIGLRYFNVYGNGEAHKGDMASPVHKFLQQAKSDGKIKIFKGSENFLRDFICVDDVSAITLESKLFPSGIYNVGTGKPNSFLSVAKIIADLTGAKIVEIPFPDHLVGKYQTLTQSDNTKINKVFTSERTGLFEGIKNVRTRDTDTNNR